MKNVFRTSSYSILIGLSLEIVSTWLGSNFLITFLKSNLITILIALLAINSTTLGIVLTKIREILDVNDSESTFKNTKKEMLMSIKEQISVIVFAIGLLILESSTIEVVFQYANLLVNGLVFSCFVYSLFVLYDTAKSVFVILDFEELT